MQRWQGFAIGLLGVLVFLVACPSGDSVSADAPLIEGVVYEDTNANGQRDDGEAGQAARTVYLDTNDNAVFDTGEPSTQTGADGTYRFTRLEPGDYIVRQVLPFGWRNVSGGVAASTARPAVKTQAIEPAIVGGVDADIREFPFMVATGAAFDDGEGGEVFGQFCGGVLIADSWVLTAAHCSLNETEDAVADPVADDYRVMLGSAAVTGEGGQVIPVSRIILHPQFDVELNVNGGYDAALWELATPVSLEANRYTVSMLDQATEALAAEGTLATVTGWGALFSGGPGPDVLQVVHVPISSAAECAANYRGSINFDTQICASVPEGGIDSCQGDSGGPLFVKNEAGDGWFHAGITSYGNGCAAPGEQGVYARTSVLSDWVKATAALPSNSYAVTLTDSSERKDIDFGNRASTRDFEETIAPRWQTTNLSSTMSNPAANSSVTFNWRILDEGTSTFSCELDVNGAEAGNAIMVPCTAGENTYTTPSTYSEGVYLPDLAITKGDITQRRIIPLVVGDPESDTAVGVLSATDTVDPNYSDTYYIDYYRLDLTGVAVGTALLIRAEADFDPYLALYDSEGFDSVEGSDELSSGGSQLIVVVEDAEYIIGVSTFEPEAVGGYTLRISTGTLAVF